MTSSEASYRPLHASEAHFESIVLQLSPQVFSGWRAFRWKKRVYTPEGRGVEPDMILLSNDSFDWAVVEVELDHHSISNHIDDQLDRLSRARYGYDLVDSLVAVGVEAPDAREYLSRRPGLLCVVDGGSLRIADCCTAHGFDMAVLVPYTNDKAEPALDVRSLPGQYRSASSSFRADFFLRESSEVFFGKRPYLVPDGFPQTEAIRIRASGEETRIALVSLGSARVAFLPEEIDVPADGTLRLGVIDIDLSIFDLIRE